MKYISRKELLETEGVTIFTYNLNTRAIKMFEFGAICLLIIGALIYPLTHFDPVQWRAAPIILGIAAVAAYLTAQRWRLYCKREYLGWDANNLYITQGSKGVAVVPWNALTLDNSGLKDVTSGSVINIHLPNEPIVQLRLVTGFVIISKFKEVLATILTHIKQNMEKKGEIPKTTPADEPNASSDDKQPVAVDNKPDSGDQNASSDAPADETPQSNDSLTPKTSDDVKQDNPKTEEARTDA